ncbi:hypothetical protein ACFLYM_02370 [Chloroflexota bacterium]
MPVEWIIRIVLLGVVHWVLAGILLHDLAYREKVFGGHKAPWAIMIILILCLGSLLYLMFHPQIIIPDFDRNDRRNDKKK